MRYYLAVLFAVLILAVPWLFGNYPEQSKAILSKIEQISLQLASALVSHDPKTVNEIQARYNAAKNLTYGVVPTSPFGMNETSRSTNSKVRILLVPGHEPNFGGAEFGALKERNMTVELVKELQEFLGKNSKYEVFVTRDKQTWYPIFSEYFDKNWQDIIAWVRNLKSEITELTKLGEYQEVVPAVQHNKSRDDVALRLFGVSKWAGDNDIDIILHVHFNDYPGHGRVPGKYSGFAIYVPQKEFLNSPTTKALAETVFKRLEKYNPVSNFKGEAGGIIEDQELIAVGAYNSINAASMLIEYGYIYEPQFTNENLRPLAIKDLAFQTYLGLEDFFDANNVTAVSNKADTLILPYKWTNPTEITDVYALQTALLLDGEYPPKSRTMSDCPRSGSFGPCTRMALQNFQAKHGITGEEGRVGSKTLNQLNAIFGVPQTQL